MKKIFAYFILFPLFCLSQKQGNIWYFGDHAGLDFNSSPPTPLLNGLTDFASPIGWNEGCSSISDSSGTLLFYSNGVLVWNKFQTIMPNGSGLTGHRSSSQSCIIVPQPGNNQYYYVFTNDAFENNFLNGLRYSIVDICLDNNKGDIVSGSKNTLLQSGTAEKLICVRHSNNIDYWLITHKINSSDFCSFLLTSSGITSTVVSSIGPNDVMGVGQMVASPNGQKIAYAQCTVQSSVSTSFFADFDSNTGVVSNPQVLSNGGREWGVCFSKDNTKLYYATNGIGNVFQYNMNAGNLASIIASKTFIVQNGPDSWRHMEIGPDGIVYVSRSGKKYLSAIKNPNNLCPSCNYVDSAIYLSGKYTSFGLPDFITGFQYQNTVPPSCFSGINNLEEFDLISAFPNPTNDIMNLNLNQQFIGGSIQIFDAIGKILQTQTIKNTTEKINLNLNSGIYFIKATTKDGVSKTEKLVIE